jgi:hypothetical protein
MGTWSSFKTHLQNAQRDPLLCDTPSDPSRPVPHLPLGDPLPILASKLGAAPGLLEGPHDLRSANIALAEVAKEIPQAVLEGELVGVKGEETGEDESVKGVVELFLLCGR